jgi:putative PIN family toxin of toxin-antitoxin system
MMLILTIFSIIYDAFMKVVLDTNVIISGLKSRNGYSFDLLQMLAEGQYEIAISTPLVQEYREIILRENGRLFNYEVTELERFIDDICHVGSPQEIFYLWRPMLKDPCDEMVLELAVAANASYIVTFNTSDFEKSLQFGIKAIRPVEFFHHLKNR